MIHIEQNQLVPENEDLRVLSVSGDYDDNDLIECCHIDNPGFALSAFPSAFIKYGGIVYQFSDPILLGKALLEIDPTCTHNAATLFKEEEARRIKREEGDFTPENPVPVDESISQVAQEAAVTDGLTDVKSSEEFSRPENIITETENINTNTTAETMNSSTEPIIAPTETISSSTPESSLEVINKNVSEIIDVANKSQEIIDALTEAPIN